MKRVLSIFSIIAGCVLLSCKSKTQQHSTMATNLFEAKAEQSAAMDDPSQKNVFQVAIASRDHSVLLTALRTAGLADVLSNAGPLTLFAPTDAAFNNLPAGMAEGLFQPEKKEILMDILQYHVSLGAYKTDFFSGVQVIGQVNGGDITITKKDGKFIVNGKATILATVSATNGMVYMVDEVLMPTEDIK